LQVKELTTQGDYQLRLRDLQTEEKLKALADAAASQAAAATARHDALDQARTAKQASQPWSMLAVLLLSCHPCSIMR